MPTLYGSSIMYVSLSLNPSEWKSCSFDDGLVSKIMQLLNILKYDLIIPKTPKLITNESII